MDGIFALDIGTRMVMGLLMSKNGQDYKITASACTEHSQRAMYDGQVHDVEEVARAVEKVKNELEEKTGETLTEVAVAAAGRALITEVAEAERQELLPIGWEKEDVLALEMEAIQQALRQIEANQAYEGNYHCVGYSLIESHLDQQRIANLVGQRGRKARVKVIATFLPRAVIDGLISVLGRVGLNMSSLTLEPIAAGQAAIPPDMRRLNLALVDIGAGTSDIALTKNGTFFAYGMVPMAGDEVTEVLANSYLLDFQTGEKIKRSMQTKQRISYTDFLGKKYSLSKEELLDTVRPVVGELANKIAGTILELNHGVPQAVILIGGGSMTPLLPQFLAEAMNLPQERIGLQVRERVAHVTGEKSVKGPESITPIGIGITALENQGLHYYSVWVNERPVPIFELQLATVAEALLASGIQPRSFLGKPGVALTFELNGEIQVIKGSMGKSAQLQINGKRGRLEEIVHPGDQISFEPGIPGEAGKGKIKDILTLPESKNILWNGKNISYIPKVFMDGQEVDEEVEIKDGAKILYIPNTDLDQFLKQRGIERVGERKIQIKLKGQEHILPEKQIISVNGRPVEKNLPLDNGDRIEYSVQCLKIKDLEISAEPWHFQINGKAIVYSPEECQIYWHGQRLSLDDKVEDGMELRVEGFKEAPTLAHLLPFAGISQQVPAGTKLILEVNGQEAEFTTPLKSGDRIKAEWGAL